MQLLIRPMAGTRWYLWSTAKGARVCVTEGYDKTYCQWVAQRVSSEVVRGLRLSERRAKDLVQRSHVPFFSNLTKAQERKAEPWPYAP